MAGKLIIFSAPSGSGKSTIINYLLKQDLHLRFSISATSRAPRGTEKNGVEYYFLTPEEFRSRIANGDFLEYEEVYTDKYYGTLKSEVERILNEGDNVIFDVDVVGGCNIKKFYGDRALIAPIEMATGKQAYFCGKPNPLMMRTGLKKLNCHSGEAVMVGDRMDTDVISGMESGMSTVLVLSGVSTRETLKTYAYRPSIVLDGVGDIAAMARREKA